MDKKNIVFLFLIYIGISTAYAQSYTIKGKVVNNVSGEAIELAQIVSADRINGAVSDKYGEFKLQNIPAGTQQITLLILGYRTLVIDVVVTGNVEGLVIPMYEQEHQIGEVVVTASESRGITSASHIGKEAMAHLQPSSFQDLLELLPGGRASDPTFSSSNQIHLREVPSSSTDYKTSSLGVSFVMDGVPISNDAALQYQTGLTGISDRATLDSGIDMRSIDTDEIASVEIVRGIASVEYGDLTSGLINIKRKEGGGNLEARFKADLKSQLFHIGKGFEWEGASPLTMNVGVNILNSRADSRNVRQSYNRMTGSWRMTKRWNESQGYYYMLGANLDYTGSFDKVKSDKDIDHGAQGQPIERYRADYSSMTAAVRFSINAKESGSGVFRSVEGNASINSKFDKVERWRYVVNGGNYPIVTGVSEGVYDAEILPSRYEATLQVDGKPFYAFAKTMATFGIDTSNSYNSLRVGVDWSMSKNYGGGLLYDTKRPISNMMSTRPRRYDAIPALHRLSTFIEERTSLTLDRWQVEIMAGLRTTTMVNIGSEFDIDGKIYLDPRLNLSVSIPAFDVLGNSMHFTFAGGAGWHTKTPTLNQLFPDPAYYDYTQLNYFSEDESKRRVNMVVYQQDRTNYELEAARNFKWEVRGDVVWAGNTLSVTYFREDLSSGFRNSSSVKTFTYRDYDESAIDGSTLIGPPSLEGLPYTTETVIEQVGTTSNGSRTLKSGVEFTLSTERIRALATRISVSGAYFNTQYSNSEPQYISTSVIINNKPYPYIGLYEQEDGRLNEMFNTNFMFDTQIPRLGLIFSTSLQCQWFLGSQNQWSNPSPTHYLDKELNKHPFTSESAENGVLHHMIRSVSDIAHLYYNTPFSMYVNLKVTKQLYRNKIRASLFVNRLLDYSPNYINASGGLTRRYSSPYFGMELNFKL